MAQAKLSLEIEPDLEMFNYLNRHLVMYDRANLVYQSRRSSPEPDLVLQVMEKRMGEYLVRAEKKGQEVAPDRRMKCQICLVDLKEGQKYAKLDKCGHYFHYSCFCWNF